MGLRGGIAAAIAVPLIAACASPSEPVTSPPETTSGSEASTVPAPEPEPAILAPPDVEGAIEEFRAYVGTKPSPEELRWRIEDLAALRNPRVVPALSRLVKDSSMEDATREAAARFLVEQGDPHALRTLRQLADQKDVEIDHPRVFVALLHEMGECDPEQSHEWLLKVGKKFLTKDADIARAAFSSASRQVTGEVVDELIRCAEWAHHAAKRGDGPDTTSCGAVESHLHFLLEQITGVHLTDSREWRRWWNEIRKIWKPPVPVDRGEPEVGAKGTFADRNYGYSVALPWGEWRLRQGSDGDAYLTMDVPDADRRSAWCELHIYETRTFMEKRPEQIAESWRLQHESKFREITKAVWKRRVEVSDREAVEQILVGLHKEHGRVELRNLFVERDGVMYGWICGRRLGAIDSRRHGLGIDLVLGSFKLTP
jgi:hypothetical protein